MREAINTLMQREHRWCEIIDYMGQVNTYAHVRYQGQARLLFVGRPLARLLQSYVHENELIDFAGLWIECVGCEKTGFDWLIKPADPSKLFIKCIQSVGRGLRKKGDKNHVDITLDPLQPADLSPMRTDNAISDEEMIDWIKLLYKFEYSWPSRAATSKIQLNCDY